MTVRDLISKNDYDYIEWRVCLPKTFDYNGIFCGICRSVDGVLISEDGDTYDEDTEILRYEEWVDLENNINNGLTIVELIEEDVWNIEDMSN